MNRKKIIFVLLFACIIYPLSAQAATVDELLMHKASKEKAFWGNYYENILWISHTPTRSGKPADDFDSVQGDDRGQTDIGKVDTDGDGKDEIIKVIWGEGVSDHSLDIELYEDEAMSELVAKFTPFGIQPNFKVTDPDENGKKEIIIWGGIWDQRIAGEDGVKVYEGHSAPHRYIAATYKLVKGKYCLWHLYTTNNKYEPFCVEQPEE